LSGAERAQRHRQGCARSARPAQSDGGVPDALSALPAGQDDRGDHHRQEAGGDRTQGTRLRHGRLQHRRITQLHRRRLVKAAYHDTDTDILFRVGREDE